MAGSQRGRQLGGGAIEVAGTAANSPQAGHAAGQTGAAAGGVAGDAAGLEQDSPTDASDRRKEKWPIALVLRTLMWTLPIVAVPSTPIYDQMPPPAVTNEDNRKSAQPDGGSPQPYSSAAEGGSAGGASQSGGSSQGGRAPPVNAAAGAAPAYRSNSDEEKKAREAAAAKLDLTPLASEPARAAGQSRGSADGPAGRAAGRGADAPKDAPPAAQRRQAQAPNAGQPPAAGATGPVQAANAANADAPPGTGAPAARKDAAPGASRAGAPPTAAQSGAAPSATPPNKPGAGQGSGQPPQQTAARPNERSQGKPAAGQSPDAQQSEAKAEPDERKPGERKPGEPGERKVPDPMQSEAKVRANEENPDKSQGEAAADMSPPEDCASDTPKDPVVLVFDGSVSMGLPVDMDVDLEAELDRRMAMGDNAARVEYRRWLATDKPKRIDVAKAAVSEMLSRSDPQLRIAAVSFTSCQDISSHRFVSVGDRTDVGSFVSAVTPKRGGDTALTASIGAALSLLRSNAPGGRGRVLVLTDGQETCGGNLCALARVTAREQPGARVDVVDLSGQSNASCITEATGGLMLNYTEARKSLSLSGLLVRAANQCQTGATSGKTAGAMGQQRQ